MGILGDTIRLIRDTTKDFFEECGFEMLKDEVKDCVKAMKGN